MQLNFSHPRVTKWRNESCWTLASLFPNPLSRLPGGSKVITSWEPRGGESRDESRLITGGTTTYTPAQSTADVKNHGRVPGLSSSETVKGKKKINSFFSLSLTGRRGFVPLRSVIHIWHKCHTLKDNLKAKAAWNGFVLPLSGEREFPIPFFFSHERKPEGGIYQCVCAYQSDVGELPGQRIFKSIKIKRPDCPIIQLCKCEKTPTVLSLHAHTSSLSKLEKASTTKEAS
jgi:hypothetical protein